MTTYDVDEFFRECVDSDVDPLELLYWIFDDLRQRSSCSERDVFKQFLTEYLPIFEALALL